jgi:hypothetical protein
MFDFGTGIFSSAKRNKERSAVCELYGAKNSVAYSITFSGFIIKTDWRKSDTSALISGWW